MSSQHRSDTIEAIPHRFVLRYRCLECGQVADGQHPADSDYPVCEHCHASLDEDDKIAHPDMAPYDSRFASEELG